MEREVLQQQMRSMMEMMQSLNKQISATTIITSDTLPPSFAANDREGSPFVSLPSTISSQGLVPIHSNPDDDPENPFRPVNEHNDRHSSTRDSKSHHENNEKGHPVPQPQFFEPPPAYDNDADGQDLQDRIYSIMPSAPPLDNH